MVGLLLFDKEKAKNYCNKSLIKTLFDVRGNKNKLTNGNKRKLVWHKCWAIGRKNSLAQVTARKTLFTAGNVKKSYCLTQPTA